MFDADGSGEYRSEGPERAPPRHATVPHKGTHMATNGYGKMQVFATTAGVPLARKICANLSCELGTAHLGQFKDGELDVRLGENVRGNDVFIVAPTPPVRKKGDPDPFFEAMLLTEAARLSSAGRITLVVPYLGYARGDRKDQPRKPISARMALKVLELGKPDRILFLDVHAEQILGCIENAVFDHLYGSAVAVPRIQELLSGNRDYIVAAPDHGAAQRAHKYARLLSGNDDSHIVIFSKRRPRPGEVDEDSVNIIGSVKGKLVILVDDLIDSAKTICLAAAKAKQEKASGVWVFGTHPVFSDGAVKRIRESVIDRVFVTDSIYQDPGEIQAKGGGKIEVLSAAGLLAPAIRRTHEGESLSELIP